MTMTRATVQAPEVLVMILCDLVITDAETNKKSLIGLFDRIETTVFPCVLRHLHVYLSLTDGHGRLPVVLSCVPSDGSDVLFRGQVVVEFRDPLQVVELHLVFPNAQFPHAMPVSTGSNSAPAAACCASENSWSGNWLPPRVIPIGKSEPVSIVRGEPPDLSSILVFPSEALF
jgi:hypothetical protein